MLRVMRRQLTCASVAFSIGLTGCGPRASPAPAAPPHAIVPTPVSVETTGGGAFRVTPGMAIVVPPGNEQAARVARYLSALIGLAAGPEPPAVIPDGPSTPVGGIHLALSRIEAAGDEGYELAVTPDRVTITANSAAGLFYGVQTFRQRLPPFIDYEAVRADADRLVEAPGIRVSDRPRFAWRGAMLDVARHFFPVEDVKRYIDLIALYKLNRLHLHLADDQGWRIEITSRPNLVARGSLTQVGGGPGGFYTQAQYADIVAYAADRFITIVPEIDMPGHTNAALVSYAELSCDGMARQPYTGIDVGFSSVCVDKPATYAFIDDVVREIAAITPGAYVHVGGDEVKTLEPAQYVRFIERVQQIVQTHGKQMIGWDEVAPARLLPTTLVQHWRPEGSSAAAAAQGVKVIMSIANRTYLDMKYHPDTPIGQKWAAYIDVEDAYAWDPAHVVRDLPASSLVGVEAPIWTETLATMHDVEYLAFPRLAAFADVAWAQPAGRDWNEFKVRLGAQAPRWSVLGVNFYRSPAVPWQP
jgi:hexosaminidase